MSESKEKNIILIGGGDFTKKIIRLLSSLGGNRILGYTDLRDMGELFGVKYLGKDDNIADFVSQFKSVNAIMCIAGNISLLKKKNSLIKFYKGLGCSFPSIISKNSYVDETVKIGEGVIVFDHAFIDFNVTIGDNSIINIDSLIGHDASIGANNTISPKSIIGGGTIIGKNCFVGINATVNPYLKIEDNCIIGAGSVINKNILESGIYAGNPFKKIK